LFTLLCKICFAGTGLPGAWLVIVQSTKGLRMPGRLSVEEKLAAIRRVREEPASPAHVAELRRALADKSSLVVAASASIVGERGNVELSADLEAAFDRFLVDPLKHDKLCRAKLAAIQALDKLEHQRPEIFRKAARHVQLEPVWGGEVDTAAPLRSAALIALARTGGSEDLPLLVDSLADPEKEVRIAAASALPCFATEASGLLLRLKIRLGDGEPEVLSECFSGLLAIDARDNLPFVAEFIQAAEPARCEAAVMALGKSRLPEACGALTLAWTQATSIGLREQILLAIAMLRLPAAIDFLIEVLRSDSERDAIAALFALKIHNYDPRLRQRIAEIVGKTGSRDLQSRFERDFPSDG
jgi:HEAT repeat protein